MFRLIQLIFIFSLLGMGYSWYKWKITGESRWRRHFRSLLTSTVAFILLVIVVLVLTRLMR